MKKPVYLIIYILLLVLMLFIGYLISDISIPYMMLMPIIISSWVIVISIVSAIIIGITKCHEKEYNLFGFCLQLLLKFIVALYEIIKSIFAKLDILWIVGYILSFFITICIMCFSLYVFIPLILLVLLSILVEIIGTPLYLIFDGKTIKNHVMTMYSILGTAFSLAGIILSIFTINIYQNKEYSIIYHIDEGTSLNTDSGTEFGNFKYVNQYVNRIWAYPEKEGYTFEGWYLDEELSREFLNKEILLKGDRKIFVYTIKPYSYQRDLHLYPKYSLNSYEIYVGYNLVGDNVDIDLKKEYSLTKSYGSVLDFNQYEELSGYFYLGFSESKTNFNSFKNKKGVTELFNESLRTHLVDGNDYIYVNYLKKPINEIGVDKRIKVTETGKLSSNLWVGYKFTNNGDTRNYVISMSTTKAYQEFKILILDEFGNNIIFGNSKEKYTIRLVSNTTYYIYFYSNSSCDEAYYYFTAK